jgi:hypothetical protein
MSKNLKIVSPEDTIEKAARLMALELDVKKIITTLPKTLDREQVNQAHKNLVSTYPYGHFVPGRDGLDFVIEVPDEPNCRKVLHLTAAARIKLGFAFRVQYRLLRSKKLPRTNV